MMDLGTIDLSLRLSQKNTGEPHLRLKLDSQTVAALPMKNAQEVVIVNPHRLTPIPNMPLFTLGLLNQRSRVYWVIDLPQLLGLTPLERDLQPLPVAIIRAGDTPIGLGVLEISGVMRLNQQAIQSPIGNVSPGFVPYLRGCVLQEKSIVLVLDAIAIANSLTN